MSDAGRLTRMDEYPRHQVGGTFDSVVSDSVHWNDGFYFTLGDEATGATMFAALRLYPNTDVMDGFACVTVDARQHNARWSRRLRPAIDDLAVGSLRLEIVEPLQRLRLACRADNPYGIAFDLDWVGLHEPYLEDRIVRYSGGRKVYDRTNYDQCCDVTGTITVAGRTLDVSPGTWVGVRDHSWGLGRTGGASSSAIAPDASRDPRRGFAMRQWTMIRMPDRVLFWQFHLQHDGSFEPLEAVVIPRDGDAPWRYVDASASAVRVDGLPRAQSSRVDLVRPDGTVDRYELTAVGAPAYLQGGGYHDGFADRRGRGVFRGESHHEGEVWDVSHPTDVVDPAGWFAPRADAWAEQFATCVNLDDPADRGFGHLECVLAP